MSSRNASQSKLRLIKLDEVDVGELEDYEQMLNCLRAVDIQKILSYYRLPSTGRKQDLQARIMTHLKDNYIKVTQKIREVYSQAVLRVHNVSPSSAALNQMLPNAITLNARCNVSNENASIAFPIQPELRLKKLPFFDVLDTLIQPSSLLPRNTFAWTNVPRVLHAHFYFRLTPEQASKISMNRDVRNAAKPEYAVQVQLRFCSLETSSEQEDCFPPSIVLKINKNPYTLPRIIPTTQTNVQPKRPPCPVNVTPHVKMSPLVSNAISVRWCPDKTPGYCLAAYLVKQLNSTVLLEHMQMKGIRPAEYTRDIIKQKLTEDMDSEIATTMVKVSLICPLGKMRMSIPCRPSTCSHLQCFDASLFLQMNERKPSWNCPVCYKPAIYDTLFIDGYFNEVLASPLLESDDTEIQLHQDGSWSIEDLRSHFLSLDSPSKPAEKMDLSTDVLIIDVLSYDIEFDDEVKVPKRIVSAPKLCQPTSTIDSGMIDLTLSDEDDC